MDELAGQVVPCMAQVSELVANMDRNRHSWPMVDAGVAARVNRAASADMDVDGDGEEDEIVVGGVRMQADGLAHESTTLESTQQ